MLFVPFVYFLFQVKAIKFVCVLLILIQKYIGWFFYTSLLAFGGHFVLSRMAPYPSADASNFLKPKPNFTAALKVTNLSQIEHTQGTQFERDSFFLYIFATHPLYQ